MITLEFLNQRPLSYSSLMAFKKSPAHYIHYLNIRKEKTPALIIGSLIDCLLFEPKQYAERFVVKPEDLNKGEGAKKRANDWKMKNQGKEWITTEMFIEANKIVSAVNKNEFAKEKLNQTQVKQSRIRFIDKETGLPMLAVLDMDSEKFVCDLKSTPSANPSDFIRSALNYDYHIQSGCYINAKLSRGQNVDYYFLVVEKSEPYGVAMFKAGRDFIQLGQQELAKLLLEFKYCMENNLWHQSYEFRAPVGYHQLNLPAWAANKIEI